MLGNLLLGSAIVVATITAAFAIHSFAQTRKNYYNGYLQRKNREG